MAILYDETLLNDRRKVITEEEAKPLFEAGLYGYGLMQKILTKRLNAIEQE